jgi:hypothetical protein
MQAENHKERAVIPLTDYEKGVIQETEQLMTRLIPVLEEYNPHAQWNVAMTIMNNILQASLDAGNRRFIKQMSQTLIEFVRDWLKR